MHSVADLILCFGDFSAQVDGHIDGFDGVP